MILVMVFVILAVLAVPYMWIIFSDDHHAVPHGSTEAQAPATEVPAPAPRESAAAPVAETAAAVAAVGAVAAAVAPQQEEPAAAKPPEEEKQAPSAAAPEASAGETEAPTAAPVTAKEAADDLPAAKPVAKKEEPPARVLPSHEEIAEWANGADVDSIGTLFEGLALKRFDTFNTQIRAKEILAQHWQSISASQVPEDTVFDGLPEVGILRQRYANQELSRARLGALKVAWRELRGKPPGLWRVPDLMAALRRIIDKNLEVDFNALLHGSRDLWSGMTLPVGREQVEILWACIDVVRKGTKK